MELHVGLDLSLRSCAACVVDSKGTILHERDLPCEIKEIAGYLTALPVSIERVGFESGTLSQHLFYGLNAEGFDVVCMEARQVRRQPEFGVPHRARSRSAGHPQRSADEG